MTKPKKQFEYKKYKKLFKNNLNNTLSNQYGAVFVGFKKNPSKFKNILQLPCWWQGANLIPKATQGNIWDLPIHRRPNGKIRKLPYEVRD